MKRLDQRLVELQLAPTRSKAQQLIKSGGVRVNGRVVVRVAETVADANEISVTDSASILKYVSRGGLKLEAAIEHFKIDVAGARCLDVGLSTGGFTDCLLQHGASLVAGFDVGHGQLHANLREESRLRAYSGVHVRDLPTHSELQAFIKDGVDLIVIDVSFIGLTHVLAHLPAQGELLALIKPQFEVGPTLLDKRGLVRDPADAERACAEVSGQITKLGREVRGVWACPVKGQDGNQEFFVYATAHKLHHSG